MLDCFKESLSRVDFYACAWNIFAREMTFLGFDKNNFAIDGGMNSEITTHERAWASDFGCASLADENFAGFNFLATKTFYAKSLAGIVV